MDFECYVKRIGSQELTNDVVMCKCHLTTFGSIVTDAKLSDCATCFDSMQTKDLPVAEYTKDMLLNKKIRCAANSLVIGPTLLRSGVMAMELVLSQGDARLRTILQT